MPFKISIASGKGGTGKTSVAVNLYSLLIRRFSEDIFLVDCDVEEPNDTLFFDNLTKHYTKDVFQTIAEIDLDSCTFCGKCDEYCAYNAIVIIPTVGFAEVNPSLCHSCGACSVACNENAIIEKPLKIGTISEFQTSRGSGIIEGRLKIGCSMQTMMIRETKNSVPGNPEIILYDAPPGTSCPVVESVTDSDYVILVTEPTPFGLHDLKLTVRLLQKIGKKFGVIINKTGFGSRDVYHYLENNAIDILGEIPFNQAFAKQYAEGKTIQDMPQDVQTAYDNLFRKIEKKLLIHEGDNYFKW